jgi:rhamnose transport system ATP-binding protein
VDTILALRGVTKSFGAVRALRGVDFDVRAGEVHALVGENGAGKSTLVKIITGAHAPDTGTVTIGGQALDRADPLLARRLGWRRSTSSRRCSPSSASRRTWPSDWRRGAPGGASTGAHAGPARRACWSASGPRSIPTRTRGPCAWPSNSSWRSRALSGAQARVIIMDEPTASLAETEAERLLALVAELRAAGVAIVYISHRLPEVLRLSDRVTVLRDGAAVETRPAGGLTQADLIRAMVGRDLDAVFPKRDVPIGDALLSARGLRCRAGGVRDVDLDVRAGEIVGLAGLVGSGRTELARVLFGLTPADGGELRVRGQALAVHSPAAAIRGGLAYVPEDRRRHGVILEMSVGVNATLAVLRAIRSGPFLDAAREREIAGTFVARFAIKAPSLDTPVANLSGGNQQKVALARWLATRPSVLILDEPTQGVDVGAKAEIHRLIVDLAAEGLAILMISSEMPEILGMSDRIAVMRGGTIVGTLGPRGGDTGTAARARPRPRGGGGLVTRGLGRYRRELGVAAALAVLLALLAVKAPAFFARREPPRPARGQRARPRRRRGNDPRRAGPPDRHLHRLAVRDLRRGRGPPGQDGLPMPFVTIGVVAAGAGLGAINGALVAGLGLPAIVVTLATMVVLREGLRWRTEGVWIQDLPERFQWFGLGQAGGRAAIVVAALGRLRGCSRGACAASRRGGPSTPPGSDPEAARLVGIHPRRVVFAAFVFMGALTGLSAVLTAIQFIDVQTSAGAGLEMKVHRGRGRRRRRHLRRTRHARGDAPRGHAAGDDRSRAHVPRNPGLLGARAPGRGDPARRQHGRLAFPREDSWRRLRWPRPRPRPPARGPDTHTRGCCWPWSWRRSRTSRTRARTSSPPATRARSRAPASRSGSSRWP